MGLRCFVAIAIPPQVRSAIDKEMEMLRHLGRDIKWVSPANIHLTLKFLGDTPEDRIDDIEAALMGAATGIGPIRADATGAGAFPNPRRPNVFWAGLTVPDELGILKERIEAALANLGFQREDRPFRPHLTVGRLRRGGHPPKRLMAALEEIKDIFFGTFEINELLLMKSDLEPKGPVYTTLRTIPLYGK